MGSTQVLLVGVVLPRRSDTTAVIGTALLASAGGVGYRRIAAQSGRPVSTVRRWVRSVGASHTEWLRAQGVAWIHTVDREVLATLTPAPTRLGEALSARPDRAVPPHPARADLDGDRSNHPLAAHPTGRRRLSSRPHGVPARPRSAATVPTAAARRRSSGATVPTTTPPSRPTPPEMPDTHPHRNDADIGTISGGQQAGAGGVWVYV